MGFAARLIGDSPLQHRPFRLFYFGAIGVALGYTMQSTVAAWLMATLTPSALMISLVQTASTAPTLLFGLSAGALADIVDRRRIMLVATLIVLATTALTGVAALSDAIGPTSLLLLTFVIGTGFTFYSPAQQASINDLVPREQVARAVALGAVAFNLARAIGPALAGAVAAWSSPGAALLIGALFFVVMIGALRGQRKSSFANRGVPETLLSGMMSGLRYTRHSPPLRALIIRNMSFAICASVIWALLPVIARDQLRLGAGGFGLLSASFGVGAILGALSLPRALKLRSLNTVVGTGNILAAGSILLLALTDLLALAVVGTFCVGVAWVCVFAGLSTGTQTAAPAWVRARAVAMNQVSVQACLAVGSALWGWLASTSGSHFALATAAGMMVVLLAINRRVRVRLGEEADVTPGEQPPALALAAEPSPDDGPVLIQIEYQVDADQRDEFLRAIHGIEAVRRRNGVTDWRLFRDLEQDGRFVERFIIQSWAEYQRLRTRLTQADRRAVEQVEAMQRPDQPRRISRLIGVEPPEDER